MDLRTSPRIPVQCLTVFSGDHLVGEGVVVNLSVPGCAIKTSKALRKGDYLELRVLIPDQTAPLAVDLAKVRWEHNGHFGLQFIRMRPSDQHRLVQLLKNRRSQSPSS
jgi:PilZ domain